MRSDIVKVGIESVPHRSLLHAVGCCADELDKAFIGVINSFNGIVPGHIHLQSVARAVSEGIRSREGVPFGGKNHEEAYF